VTDAYQKIIDRLPGFYRAWDYRSNMASITTSTGNLLKEQNKDLFGIMRSHWVDSAFSNDLDLIGAIFRLRRRKNEVDESFRTRIKYFVAEFMGGGTREAILAQTMLFIGSRQEDHEVDLIENPPTKQTIERPVKNGDSWLMKSNSINDEVFSVIFEVEKGKQDLLSPAIVDSVTNQSIVYNGVVKSGQTLTIDNDGQAKIDNKDVSAKITNSGLKILRKGSIWTFQESTSPNIGKFDEGVFDTHVFETAVASVFLKIEWTARLISAFELKVLNAALERSGVTKEELQGLINRVKSAGVKSIITIANSFSPDTGGKKVAK
jgi:hypothetical protein